MIQKNEVPFVRKFQYNKTCLDLVKNKFHKQNNTGLQSFSRIKMNKPIPKYNIAESAMPTTIWNYKSRIQIFDFAYAFGSKLI